MSTATTATEIKVNADTPEFTGYLLALSAAFAAYWEHNGFTHAPVPVPTFTIGNRYIRIASDRSVHSFIDRTNGDVLKPAGFRAPAKHARGNLFAGQNGSEAFDKHGWIKYLR